MQKDSNSHAICPVSGSFRSLIVERNATGHLKIHHFSKDIIKLPVTNPDPPFDQCTLIPEACKSTFGLNNNYIMKTSVLTAIGFSICVNVCLSQNDLAAHLSQPDRIIKFAPKTTVSPDVRFEATLNGELYLKDGSMPIEFGSVLDVLEKSNFLNLDRNNSAITMKNKSELRLYMDGVLVRMSEFQMYQYLKHLKMSHIESIEIEDRTRNRNIPVTSTGTIRIETK